MAKGIYVGVGGVAHKAKKAYVGVDSKARKVKKGYIGVGGVAQLFYSANADDIIPKTWTEVTAGTSYIASDGTKLTASHSASASYYPIFACDNNLSSNWVTGTTPNTWIKLQFPNAIEITKMKISTELNATFNYVTSCKIQGSNDNSTWTDLYTFASKVSRGLNEIVLTKTMKAKYYRIYSEKTKTINEPRVFEWQVSEFK